MQDRTEAGQVRCSSGAGYVSWRKGHMLCFAGQILYRTDAGHGGCWTGRKQDILDAGQDKCSAGCMQGRTDAGQVICRTWQIHCFEGSSWLLVCDWIKKLTWWPLTIYCNFYLSATACVSNWHLAHVQYTARRVGKGWLTPLIHNFITLS